MVAIETDGLTKRYEGRRRIPGIRGAAPAVDAVVDLDLRVREGEVFEFLGPNGAGKSTTINVLLDGPITDPEYEVPPWFVFLTPLVWIVLPVLVGYWLFRGADLD